MGKYLSIFTLLFFITSCVETVVAGSTFTGVVIAQNKSFADAKSDFLITTQINKEFLANGLKNPLNKIGVTVDEQRLLLTGLVDDADLVRKANEIAWKVVGVKEVIDEIQINENKLPINNFINYFKDVAITAQIGSKALLDKKVSSLNFEVITINKVVYLIGTVKNAGEINFINDIAAKTSGVSKVISHIVLAD